VFEGFALEQVDADGVAIRTRYRLAPGRPPLLLLHGNRQTHYCGHYLPEERPAEVAAAFEAFFAD
jgi:hypothetical protein